MDQLVFGIAVVAGMLVMLAVIIGFLVRARELGPAREFSTVHRPENMADLPFVTIIVPARNEERNIASCVESLMALDYPSFEIFVIDDHSTDRTAEIVREIIERDTSQQDTQLFHLSDDQKERRVEWACRKSYALWYGAQQAQGEWVLFVDADTRQKTDTLWRAISFSLRYDLQALSLSGVFVNPGFWGGILEAVLTPAIFLAIPWHRVNNPGEPAAWMNGNFILYNRMAYFKVDGHRAVADFIQDDLALALHSKTMRVRFLFLPVSSAYECRDYVGLKEAFHGWTRRLAVGGACLHMGHGSYAFKAAVLFIVGVWPVLAATIGFFKPFAGHMLLGMSFGAWALVQLGSVILLQGTIRAFMRMPVWPAVLAPFGASIGIAVVVKGYRNRYVKKSIELRGRVLDINDKTD